MSSWPKNDSMLRQENPSVKMGERFQEKGFECVKKQSVEWLLKLSFNTLKHAVNLPRPDPIKIFSA